MPKTPKDAPPADFASLGLSDPLVAAVTALGYEEPTPIQREAIPVLLAGRDVLGQAATGTGQDRRLRAAAAPADRGGGGAPRPDERPRPRAHARAGDAGGGGHPQVRRGGSASASCPLYGGAPMDQQIRALQRGADVVVATPGRALDHLRRGAR